jgi:hypothetical protein
MAHAADLYVATDGSNTTHSSWSTAYTNVQDALNAATNGDTIYVAGHTFALTDQLLWAGKTNMTVRGGYAATNDADQPGPWDSRQWPTVLNTAGSSNRVMTITNVASSMLESVTLTGGYATNGNGGGIFITSSTGLVLSACIITNNATAPNVSGGGICAQSSFVIISNCLVKGNSAVAAATVARYGGGIYVISGNVTIRDSVIAHNVLTGGYYRYGGGICAGGTCALRNCLLVGNSTSGSLGDGFFVSGGSTRLENCTVADNTGQGIYRSGGTITVTNSILWGNGDDVTGTVTLAWSDVEDGDGSGMNGNLSADPLFERGYYLATHSPCVDVGTNTAIFWDLTNATTRVNGVNDSGIVDLGYHYPSAFDPDLADLYVATNGFDGNSGTNWASAYRTLTKALSVAKNGCTVHVGAGSYTNGSESFPLTLASRMGVQILGAGSTTTVINATGGGNRVMTVTQCSRIGIADATLTGGYLAAGGSGGCLSLLNCGGVALVGCVVTNNSTMPSGNGGGIYAGSSVVSLDNCLVRGNTLRISSTVSYYGGGICAQYGAMTLRNSTVASNRITGGYYRYGGGMAARDALCVLRNCLVEGNSTSGVLFDGLYVDGLSSLVNVENCTFVNNASQGVSQVNGSVTVTNSILWANGDDVTGTVALAWSDIEDGDNNGTNGCVSVDPLFVNANRGDYRLMKTSPCVNAGVNLAWMNGALDLDGNPRVKVGKVDMGAYECQAVSGTMLVIR